MTHVKPDDVIDILTDCGNVVCRLKCTYILQAHKLHIKNVSRCVAITSTLILLMADVGYPGVGTGKQISCLHVVNNVTKAVLCRCDCYYGMHR